MTKKTADSLESLPPIHPGEILEEESLRPMNITQYRLAKSIGVDARRVHAIVNGERAYRRRRRCCSRASSGIPPGSGWGCRASTTWKRRRTVRRIG